ncbi:DUF2513 domain-containing protein [Vagococcus fluvialis]|uniref:DUF2513 domain-containing protein n=1 Tax=Vagococcus fluvialis TaxID=2738 RepID=UPI00378B5A76
MELKAELIRDLLLYSESVPLKGIHDMDEIFNSELLSKYSEDEIIHAISVMGSNDANLFASNIQWASDEPYFILVGSPTFEGHKYLDNIRDPEVWKQTKKATSKFASVSIDVLSSVAASVITKMLGMG